MQQMAACKAQELMPGAVFFLDIAATAAIILLKGCIMQLFAGEC
jgi:hypothetical protein